MALLTGGHHNRQNVVIYNAEVHSHRHAYRLSFRHSEFIILHIIDQATVMAHSASHIGS